jgi:hypothetical protein
MAKGDVNDLKSVFKFFFLRDPSSRILSAYKDKVVRRGYLSAGGKIKSSSFLHASSPPSFEEFLTYLENDGLYANAHWAPQASLLLLPVRMFDYIGRFENLRDDLNYVVGKIFDKELSGSLNIIGPPPTGSSNDYMEHLTQDQLRRIANLYKEDFHLLEIV